MADLTHHIKSRGTKLQAVTRFRDFNLLFLKVNDISKTKSGTHCKICINILDSFLYPFANCMKLYEEYSKVLHQDKS